MPFKGYKHKTKQNKQTKKATVIKRSWENFKKNAHGTVDKSVG